MHKHTLAFQELLRNLRRTRRYLQIPLLTHGSQKFFVKLKRHQGVRQIPQPLLEDTGNDVNVVVVKIHTLNICPAEQKEVSRDAGQQKNGTSVSVSTSLHPMEHRKAIGQPSFGGTGRTPLEIDQSCQALCGPLSANQIWLTIWGLAVDIY